MKSLRTLLEDQYLDDDFVMRKIFEASNNPVDQELERAADAASKKGSLDAEDISDLDDFDASMDDDLGMDDLGEPADDTDPEGFSGIDNTLKLVQIDEPIEPEIMTHMQGHDYITKYDHDDPESDTNPLVVMDMDIQELGDLRKQVRIYLDQVGLTDRVGSYSNPEVRAANDLLSFVDQVMVMKKQEAKDAEAKNPVPKPKVQQDAKQKSKAPKGVKSQK